MPKTKSSPKTCLICYQPFKKTISSCKCHICVSCWPQIIISKIQESHSLQETIKCPAFECQQELPIISLYHQIPKTLQNQIDKANLNIYLTKTPDIRKCPSSKCNYAGVIDISSSCPEKLRCNVCGTQWREKVHFTKAEKVQESINHLTQHKNNIFSGLWKRLRAKKCPSCEVIIEKNGGCDHMTCSQCQAEFCWIFFRLYPLHSSFPHNMKPIISTIFTLITIGVILLLIFMLPPVNMWIHSTLVPKTVKFFLFYKETIRLIVCLIVGLILSLIFIEFTISSYHKLTKYRDYFPMSKTEMFVRFTVPFVTSFLICYFLYNLAFWKIFEDILSQKLVVKVDDFQNSKMTVIKSESVFKFENQTDPFQDLLENFRKELESIIQDLNLKMENSLRTCYNPSVFIRIYETFLTSFCYPDPSFLSDN